MFGAPVSMFNPGGGSGAAGGYGITGSPSTGWTFNAAAQASTAEANIVTFKVSDDATAGVILRNQAAGDNRFSARWITTGPNLNSEYVEIRDFFTGGSVDSGSLPLITWRFGISSLSTAAATRPIWRIVNGPNTVFEFLPLNSGANSALSWGTQSTGVPAFTNRSIGTRLVLYNNLSGSTLDYALGVESGNMWLSSAGGFKFYNNSNVNIFTADTNGRQTVTVSAVSDSLPAGRWTNGTVNADLRIGSTPDLQFGTSSNHTVSLIQNNTIRATLTSLSTDFATTLRATGSGTPASGAGVEITFGAIASSGRILAWDRTAAAARDLYLQGANVYLRGTAGTTQLTVNDTAITANLPVGLKSYTVATLPVATTAGHTVYVSDAAGSPCIALANGSVWKRCDDCTVTVT